MNTKVVQIIKSPSPVADSHLRSSSGSLRKSREISVGSGSFDRKGYLSIINEKRMPIVTQLYAAEEQFIRKNTVQDNKAKENMSYGEVFDQVKQASFASHQNRTPNANIKFF